MQYAACFDVLVPGNLADGIARFPRRGREVAVEGWLDPRPLDGGPKSVRIVADAVEPFGADRGAARARRAREAP